MVCWISIYHKIALVSCSIFLIDDEGHQSGLDGILNTMFSLFPLVKCINVMVPRFILPLSKTLSVHSLFNFYFLVDFNLLA